MDAPGGIIKAVYLLYPHDILLNLFRSEQRKGITL